MNSKHKKPRYDSWGNKILSFMDMRKYYARCDRSLEVLRSCLPHQFTCIPDITIRLDVWDPKHINLTKVYPGETIIVDHYVGERALEAFRNMVRKPKSGWKTERKGQTFYFQRKGFLHRLKFSKYGNQ